MKFSILKLFTIIHISTLFIIFSIILYWQSSLINEFHNTQIKSYFEQIDNTTKVFIDQEKELIKNTIQSNIENKNPFQVNNIDFTNINYIFTTDKNQITSLDGYNLFIKENIIKQMIQKLLEQKNLNNNNTIHTIEVDNKKYFLILHSEKIIDNKFGKVLGNIVGLEILNNNQLLMFDLKNKVKIKDIYLLNSDNKIIASTKNTIHFDRYKMNYEKVYESQNKQYLYLKKQLHNDLDIIYSIDNSAYNANLEQQYKKLAVLLVSFLILGAIVFFSIKYFLLNTLEHLQSFIKATLKNNNIKYKNSHIKEIDDIANDFYTLFHKHDKKEKFLFQQSKLISMGEMVANIAHQWRQPLCTISLNAGIMQTIHERKIKDKELMNSSSKEIDENIQYLTNTIDTFIDFVNNKENHQDISIQEVMQQTKSIVGSTLTQNGIELIDKVNYKISNTLFMRKGELAQVLINLLNNSKDILLERKIEKPWIKINFIQNSDHFLITIEDNGKGIKKEIIDKVFEPYFTTKHQSRGTGLGLYMSYSIVTESFHGEIWVENSKNGAKFYITIPKKDP